LRGEFIGTKPFLLSCPQMQICFLFENCVFLFYCKKTKEHTTFIIVLRVAVIKSSHYLKIVLVSRIHSGSDNWVIASPPPPINIFTQLSLKR